MVPSRISHFNQSKAISCLCTKFQVQEQHSGSSFALTSRSIAACIKPWFGLKSLQTHIKLYTNIHFKLTLCQKETQSSKRFGFSTCLPQQVHKGIWLSVLSPLTAFSPVNWYFLLIGNAAGCLADVMVLHVY